MANRRRANRLYIYVSNEEKETIEQNIQDSQSGNLSNYARQLLINGTVTQIDVSAIRELHHDLANISRDLHQIVYRAALINDLHEQDYRDILADYKAIRSKVNQMMSRQMHAASKAGALPKKKQNGSH